MRDTVEHLNVAILNHISVMMYGGIGNSLRRRYHEQMRLDKERC